MVEILALRHNLWEKVKSRRHFPIKVFPFGHSSSDLMLYGTVEYVLKSDERPSMDWAARATLVVVEGVVKLKHYQVYLVSRSYRATRLNIAKHTKDTAVQSNWK